MPRADWIKRCDCGKAVYEAGLCYGHFQDMSPAARAVASGIVAMFGAPILTDQEREVLYALSSKQWARPMDIGGSDSSHHSRTLARLVKRGLVERQRRSVTWGKRGSYEYRRLT